MEDHLSNALAEELGKLKTLCLGNSIESESGSSDSAHESFDRVVAETAGIVNYLAYAPHSPAKTIAGQMGLTRNELTLSYKLIQRTKAATEHLKASPNRDYLNIVNHYFINQMYVVVFFVGLAWPVRVDVGSVPMLPFAAMGRGKFLIIPEKSLIAFHPVRLNLCFGIYQKLRPREFLCW